MSKKNKIYLDTSVIGGCYDDEFSEWSNKLITECKSGVFVPVVSELTEAEISKAPIPVQQILVDLLNHNCEVLEENEETIELAQKYIQNNILPKKYEDDARHVAIATIYNIDMIISWNFKHIVHFDKIRQFNSINLIQGYKLIEIFSPREVIFYEN